MWISLKHSVWLVERSLHAKNQLDRPTASIEHRLVTDRQTDRHRAIANTPASIVSRVTALVQNRGIQIHGIRSDGDITIFLQLCALCT